MSKTLLMLCLCLALTAFAGPAHAWFAQPLPYPYVLSQPMTVLPPGFMTIIAGTETYYYSKGTFYQKDVLDQVYAVVPPPIGAVIYKMPVGYQLMLIQGVPYYVYNGVFYRRVLEGYQVIEPPVPLY